MQRTLLTLESFPLLGTALGGRWENLDPSSAAAAPCADLTSAGAGFRMTDFLPFAGVDPASRGQ